MLVVIDVNAYYEWEAGHDDEHNALFKDGEFTGDVNEWRPAANTEEILKRVLVNQPTYTTISIPPDQAQVVVDSPSLDHVTDLNQAFAFHVARNMRLQSPREHWTAIHVDADPDLERFLSAYFQMDVAPKPIEEDNE